MVDISKAAACVESMCGKGGVGWVEVGSGGLPDRTNLNLSACGCEGSSCPPKTTGNCVQNPNQ